MLNKRWPVQCTSLFSWTEWIWEDKSQDLLLGFNWTSFTSLMETEIVARASHVSCNFFWCSKFVVDIFLWCVLTACPPQCLQNQSSDIRLVSERVLWWVFREPATPSMEPSLIKPLLKSLLDNTKDKNTTVRAQSEHTIVNLLRLRQGEEIMQVGFTIYCCYSHTNDIPAVKPVAAFPLTV